MIKEEQRGRIKTRPDSGKKGKWKNKEKKRREMRGEGNRKLS